MSRTLENTDNLFDSLNDAKCKKDNTFVFVLKPDQLNVLGQAFRPIVSGNISELTDSYLVIDKPNIKLQSAPEFVFPKSIVIPLEQIAVFFEYDSNKRFPLY